MALPRVLILGAGGQLGKKVGEVFKSRSWNTFGVDVFAAPQTMKVIRLDANMAAEVQSSSLQKQLGEALGADKLDAIVNVAGGFAAGNAADPTVVLNTRAMVESSLYSSVMAAQVASSSLKSGGLLILPGAAAALGPTSWGLPYGAAKAAVHHLIRSLADAEGAGFQSGVKTIGIAPITLDTAQNREAMPDADTGTWASLEEVARKMEEWCADPSGVESGLVYVVNKKSGDAAEFNPTAPL